MNCREVGHSEIGTSEHIKEIRSRALLEKLYQQLLRVPFHMSLVIVAIAGMASQTSPLPQVLAWVSAAAAVQIVRYVVISRFNRTEFKYAQRRVQYFTALSLLIGCVLASSTMFFATFDEVSRVIYTMIMIGLMSATIVSSHGHTPYFLAYAGPISTALTVGWMNYPLQSVSTFQQLSLIFLIGSFTVFLVSTYRDAFHAFEANIILTSKLRKALEAESQANAAKTRFLAAASHDLRQPLHTMSMLSAALTLRPLDAESAGIASRISDAMAELSTELDSLLDISKLDAGVILARPIPFPINPLIERLIQDYQPAAMEKGIELSARLRTRAVLNNDRGLLERVLRNLLDNAIKYTDVGSVVVDVAICNERCFIAVEDTGVGIPRSEQNRVHEEFYQLHNPERDRNNGLGLGLSIVRRLVPLLHAEIELISTPAQGTVFTLSLPGTISPLNSSSCTPSTDLLVQKTHDFLDMLSGKHALIVDDDREVRRGMRTLLESVNVKVSEATCTRQATTSARNNPPDIALIDLRLPNGDSGDQTIRALRKVLPELPVIFISGELDQDQFELIGLTNCDYLVKPVEMSTLFNRILRMLEADELVT